MWPCWPSWRGTSQEVCHHVTIYEELSRPGGTAWYGIPDYHLPKNVLDYEIERIKGMGVNIKTDIKVGKDITMSQAAGWK